MRQLVTGEDPDATMALPRLDEFRDAKGYATAYKPAPELAELATGLVEAYPQDYGRLRQFGWVILWAQTLGKIGDEPRVVKVERLRGLARHYAPHHEDVAIAIARDACAAGLMTRFDVQHWVNVALELIEVGDTGDVRVLPRLDPEREAVLVERYGVQTRRQHRLAAALAALQPRQLGLFGEEDDDAPTRADIVTDLAAFGIGQPAGMLR